MRSTGPVVRCCFVFGPLDAQSIMQEAAERKHQEQALVGAESGYVSEELDVEKLEDVIERDDEQNPPLQTQSCLSECRIERLASLDVFRGLTVAAMILVDYGGGLWSGISHSPWNGVTFADFVVPAFLFIVGLSLALAHQKLPRKTNSVYKVLFRVMKLFALGLILQGGYIHGLEDLSYGVNLQSLRIMGVLQRIAFAYAVVALLEVFSSKDHISDTDINFLGIAKMYIGQWITAFLFVSVYTGLLYGLYVPDWQFEAPSVLHLMQTNTSVAVDSSLLLVKCNVRGSLQPDCNAVGYIDRMVMGLSHLYQHPAYRRSEKCSVDSPYTGPLPDDAPPWCMAPFDPEGLLSSLPAAVTCFFGAQFGHILLHMKGYKKHLSQWTVSGCILLSSGILVDVLGMPMNKQLYTLSYMFTTGGAAALVFCAIYVLVDIYNWASWFTLFKWIGEHSLMMYALIACGILPIFIQGLYWKSPERNLVQIVINWLGL